MSSLFIYFLKIFSCIIIDEINIANESANSSIYVSMQRQPLQGTSKQKKKRINFEIKRKKLTNFYINFITTKDNRNIFTNSF